VKELPDFELKQREDLRDPTFLGGGHVGWEADHGALKRLINPTRGFKALPTVSATTKGLGAMRMIRKRQYVRRGT
jgi:hypothetical protein